MYNKTIIGFHFYDLSMSRTLSVTLTLIILHITRTSSKICLLIKQHNRWTNDVRLHRKAVSFCNIVCLQSIISRTLKKTFHLLSNSASLRYSELCCEVHSKVHLKIRKLVCKLSIWLASLSSGANHSLYLQTDLQILK